MRELEVGGIVVVVAGGGGSAGGRDIGAVGRGGAVFSSLSSTSVPSSLRSSANG